MNLIFLKKNIWHKLNYFSFFQIFEKLFVTCAQIFIKLKICKFSTVRFETQTLKFKNLRQDSLDTLKSVTNFSFFWLFIYLFIYYFHFLIENFRIKKPSAKVKI
jgi:hypothetical protein